MNPNRDFLKYVVCFGQVLAGRHHLLAASPGWAGANWPPLDHKECWVRQEQTETDRNRLEQAGTDRNRLEQTGTDRNRQEQTVKDSNRQEQTGINRNSHEQTGTD